MKSLYLVDVSSMIFRAFYAIRPLTSADGTPTNSVYGVLSMLTKLMREIKPDYLAVCYDRPEPSFRKEIDQNYKANRNDMPPELIPQMPLIRQLIEKMGIPAFELKGYEADDLIGSLACWGRTQDLDVVIVSGDKDFAQIVQPHVSLYDTMKEKRFDREAVKEKWGVYPEQFIDYLALTGDSSDNIPGVRGIGPKGACKLLEEFKDLKGIYEGIESVKPPGVRKKLEESKDDAWRSRELVTIVKDLNPGWSLDKLRLQSFDREALRTFLVDLNFQSFITRLLGESTQQVFGQFNDQQPINAQASESAQSGAQSNRSPAAIETDTQHESSEAKTQKTYSFDDGPQFTSRELSSEELDQWLKVNPQVNAVVTVRGLVLANETEAILTSAHPTLSGKEIEFRGFDLKKVWHEMNIQEPKPVWDSAVAAYVLRAGSIGGLDKVLQEQCGLNLSELAQPAEYAQGLICLEKALDQNLEELNLKEVYLTLDLPLVPVLYDMEKNGIAIDIPFLQQMTAELETEIRTLEKQIHEDAGGPFNIGSPKQLGEILFVKLALPRGRKTKTGYSTDSDVLEKLRDHPIAAKILNYRELTKLKSTYTDALPQLVQPQTQRLHTSFSQILTTTGRLSSSTPNLQNIPIRTERGRQIRKAFRAEAGHVLISADYSQIELRILAHMAADPGLQSAFANDLDIHTATAAEIYEIALDKVTGDQRRMAKAVNFGIAYGQGAFGLADTLGIPRAEAKNIIARYFERFSGVRRYMEETVINAHRDGFVETLFKRRRYLPELKAKSPMQRKFGERAAINAPIQGTASDLMKLVMIEAHQKISGKLLLQVHDELIFEVPENQADAVSAQVKSLMEGIVQLDVPLKANVAFGQNWHEAK